MTKGRDAAGRFAPGFSPDRGRGRAGFGGRHFPDGFRTAVLTVANAPMTMRDVRGKRRVVPLFELMVWRMASGQTSRRLRAMYFIRLVFECAGQPERAAAASLAATIAALHAERSYVQGVLLYGTEDEFDEAFSDYIGRLRTLERLTKARVRNRA